jgi:hypothetical protein
VVFEFTVHPLKKAISLEDHWDCEHFDVKDINYLVVTSQNAEVCSVMTLMDRWKGIAL